MVDAAVVIAHDQAAVPVDIQDVGVPLRIGGDHSDAPAHCQAAFPVNVDVVGGGIPVNAEEMIQKSGGQPVFPFLRLLEEDGIRDFPQFLREAPGGGIDVLP